MEGTIDKLKVGDLIEIIAPAKAIEEEHVIHAKEFFEKNGFRVKISDHCLDHYNYFSGTIQDRIQDFQEAIDNPRVKAVVCARGGYGCIQIVDKVDWTKFHEKPKWIIGFSDVTVFHQHAQKFNIESLHATMPLNFKSNTKAALDTLMTAICKKQYSIQHKSTPDDQFGSVTSTLIGGNLSIIFSLLGTNLQPDFNGKILFIEDLCEHIYHIDRMFHALEKAGVLNEIGGLIVGGMTDLKDTVNPYGSTYQEVVLSHLTARNIPVCFDFPAGHIDDNRALILGSQVDFIVNDAGTTITFKG